MGLSVGMREIVGWKEEEKSQSEGVNTDQRVD